jgi:hypothetical protein
MKIILFGDVASVQGAAPSKMLVNFTGFHGLQKVVTFTLYLPLRYQLVNAINEIIDIYCENH